LPSATQPQPSVCDIASQVTGMPRKAVSGCHATPLPLRNRHDTNLLQYPSIAQECEMDIKWTACGKAA